LSIDADVQRVAEEELKGKRGAVVAIEPKTGEVLALASAPDYDLNEFSYVTSKEYLQKLYNDPDKPFFNRATMSTKPPGSTFKILASIAALDLGVIDTATTFFCPGYFTYGRVFKCDGVHGRLNVEHAIEKSCNVFFYNLIYKIGIDRWAEYARRFGFTRETGIDIGEEVSGFVPDSKYYEKIYGPKWPRSIMASLGIGQGEVNVTPIQLAQFAALVANDGHSYTPHIVKGYLENGTRKFVPFKFKAINVGINKKIFDIVKYGMYLVVNGAGTAAASRSKEIKFAGKTGTAQNPHGKDHALFIAFAPYKNPKIALSVVIENVGFGATYAAPIAKK
ncbi:MAG: penicillin-binding transpeptidase domain-containing protein, partial [Ignavibacteriaceae bacterium]